MDYINQHFVPQFYLKRFTGDDGLLHIYDKDTDRIFRTSPRNVAAERRFYELPDSFHDPLLMEQQFTNLEQLASSITEDWLGSLQPGQFIEIPSDDRETMSLYITTQLLRTAEARTLLNQGISSDHSSWGNPVAQRNVHIQLLWNDEVVSGISEWVAKCSWVFRINSLEELLYTSDDPIKVRNKTEHLYWGQMPREGDYLLFPLTPKVMMYCFDAIGWSNLKPIDCHVIPIPLEAELVRDANIHQVGHARRFVFSERDDFDVAREFCANNPGAVGQQRPRFQT